MTDRRPHFSISGIPVRVEPLFLAVIVLLGIVPGQSPVFLVSWVVVATGSILVHELGHAVAYRYYGVEPRIVLHGLGGLTSGVGRFSPGQRIVVSLAGPLAALVLLGLPAYALLGSPSFAAGDGEVILRQLVFVNVVWSLANLLPILPLDGGNVVLAVVDLILPRNAHRIANVVSILVAAALGWWAWDSLGYEFGLVVAAMLIGVNVIDLLRTREEGLGDELSRAQQALVSYQPAMAEQIARSVLAKRPGGEVQQWATELLAWARLAQGDPWGAREVLVTMPPGQGPSASLRGALAIALGNPHEGVPVLAWAVANEPDDAPVLFGSIAAAQTGQVGAVAHELVLLGPSGFGAANRFRSLLELVGHRAEAALVAQVVAGAVPGGPATA